MSKAIVVTLPFALLLLDYWPLKRTKIRQQDEEQNAPPPVAARKEKISFLFLEKTPLLALSADKASKGVFSKNRKDIFSLRAATGGGAFCSSSC